MYVRDPWQVVPRQIFTPYDCLFISVVSVVLCRVGCLWVADVMTSLCPTHKLLYQNICSGCGCQCQSDNSSSYTQANNEISLFNKKLI